MKKKKTLILIDGHALAFRQYYALERTNMSTSDGTPTWGVYGFFKAIFDLLKNKKFKTDAIAVAFDVSHHTFRVDKYSEYKANRVEMPDPMRIQMGFIMEGLNALNIPIYTKEGYEADDVIGTIAKRACELGHNVLILTGDQDAFQLVDKEGCIKVIIPYRGELSTYDWDRVREKMGVYPNQIIDYKALRGDTSDNIPGVFGIGEKTATKLLADYGTLENVLAQSHEMQECAIKNKLLNGVESAKLSKFLATIVTDVDIDFDFSKACIELPDVVKVNEFFRKMQFYSFIKNMNSIMMTFNNGTPCTKEDIIVHSETAAEQMQLSLLNSITSEKTDENVNLELIQSIEQLKDAVENIKKQTLIAFNCHADIKDIVNSHLYGISIAYNPDVTYQENKINAAETDTAAKIYYIPFEHANINISFKIKEALPYLKDVFENPDIKKTAHNIKIQYGVLRDNGIYTKGFVFDTMLASYISNPSKNHELAVQSIEYLEHSLNDYDIPEGKKDKIRFSELAAAKVKSYVSDYVNTILNLTKHWSCTLTDKEKELLNGIDLPIALVLADMEFTGISIDRKLLDDYARVINKVIYKIERKIYEIAGDTFNLNSPKQIAEIIYDKLKISKRKKRSTGADVLETLAKDNEICRLILEYRKYYKLKTVYIDSFPNLIDPKDNRIHTTFNMTTTTTGRLSSSTPNLQNLPVRTEEGSKIRQALVPEDKENGLILSADYSQIELRLLAHISGDKNLIDAFNNGIDIHTATASKVFDVPLEKVTKEMRYKAKAVNFGIIYGQSKYGLAKALDISNQNAQNFIDRYFRTFPGVKKYMKDIVALVEKEGYLETMFGRKRYFAKELESNIAAVREFARRAAINFPIQSAGADLIKKAMIECHKKLQEQNLKSKMIIQVHDEIVIETYKDELDAASKIVREAMELGQPFKVPLVVDIAVGETWKE